MSVSCSAFVRLLASVFLLLSCAVLAVNCLSFSIYNDSECGATSLYSSYQLPSLGYYGTPTNWSCALSTPSVVVDNSLVQPSPTTASATSLTYWCRYNSALNSTAMQAYLLNSTATDCENAANNLIYIEANSFTPSRCTSITLRQVQRSTQQEVWAKVNCDNTASVLLSSTATSAAAATTGTPMFDLFYSISIAVVATLWSHN